MTRLFTGVVIAAVGCMAVALVGRSEQWSPFALALAGMTFGATGTVVALYRSAR